MKKLILTAALASSIVFANAQEMMSKKGTPILPEAGDWSIGFQADPLIRYFGNLFSQAGNNNSALAPQVPNTLVGLYVVDANTAYRAKLRLGFGSTKQDELTSSDATAGAFVTDTKKSSDMNITLGAGIQKSRGKGRLHGIYGAEAAIMIGSSKDTYTYGNAISSTNQSPTSHNFGGNLSGAGRATEIKNGSTFGFGLDGFIGAEYFFAPKMSLSAEYAWGLNLSSTGEGSSTTEAWDATANAVKVTTTKTGKSSSFGVDVVNAGSITFHLYF